MPSLAATVPTLDIIMDPSKDVVPLRCVIVGGGYAGSKLAYLFDSIFDITLIDEKNYFELTNDIIPIVANPWNDRNEEACRRLLILHRYYLKHANVLTGTVHGVDEKAVMLRDGRRVPYDLLFASVGERKPFPFSTTQRTVAGRVQELKEFNKFLSSCKKVAVLGGGPVGTSLTLDLAQSRPELEVHLFHSKTAVVPRLPSTSRRYAQDALESHSNVKLHLCTRVTGVIGHSACGDLIENSGSALTGIMGSVLRPFKGPSRALQPARYTVKYEKMTFTPCPQQIHVSQGYFGSREAPLGVPRPIAAGSGQPNILAEHEMPDGHYRVSTLMQLYGRPNIWAPGRCNNLPCVRSYGLSDVQVRTIFRGLNSVINNPTERFLHSQDGVNLQRLSIPRMLIRLGNQNDAVGCTPWSGAMVGLSAFHEFMQDRNYLVKEFQKPIFYKRQDPSKVKQRISNWMAHEITDIVDFSHC
uniref:FAD/NAD(P)-binding domain-containing protein n=1 Tax=Trypanosoma vivax (strain Y486) TaxID=1055687 RepID=G0TYQ5_TRYVY|nr:conserved hypothetical protein, fragment [Trypanosoma vivax Y486]